MRVWISDLKNFIGKEVKLYGWVDQIRSSGKVRFLLLRDGTAYCQCIFLMKKCDPSVFETFLELTQETSIAIEGEVKEEKRSIGGLELHAKTLKILGGGGGGPPPKIIPSHPKSMAQIS